MSKQVQEAYIVAATRTPIGRSGRGYFRNTRPDDLLVAAIRSAMTQVPSLDPKAIEDAIIGCSFPEGEQGMNMARVAVALAFSNPVGGVTVNRFCASGITAIQMAADRIRVGEADVLIAGGAESMSLVPMGGNKPSFNPAIFERDENIGIAYGMGITAEKVAAQWKVSREAQDAFALESHQRAMKAQAAGEFTDEMTPIDVVDRFPNLATGEQGTKTRTVKLDEGPRPDTSLEGLAKLRPVFAAKGSVTAGNSSQVTDGAALLLLASQDAVDRYQLEPLGCISDAQWASLDPATMGLGPVHASTPILERHQLGLNDLDLWEMNEAFAAQVLGCVAAWNDESWCQENLGRNALGLLDLGRLNVDGGAIALGHPVGASGARIVLHLLHVLRREKKKRGIATICIGGGQGGAMLVEAL